MSAPSSPPDWTRLETFRFGDGPDLADELLALVLAGTKTATCWAARHGLLTQIGKRMVVLDGADRPAAILETLEVTERRYLEVDAAFAHDEGEGDRSLGYWRAAHREYFEKEGCFAPDMPLYCERFRLVRRIDPAEIPAGWSKPAGQGIS